MLYIKNCEAYTPYKIIKGRHIVIQGSKITKISKRPILNLGPAIEMINAKGNILCPGFIDVHLQGTGGCDFLDATKEALRVISKTLAKFGTTAFLATTVFKNSRNPHIENIVKQSRNFEGAQLLGIHLEGPFINPIKKGMIRPNGIARPSLEYLDKIFKITNGRLKMMTVAPELSASGGKGSIEIIKKLKRNKIIASFGHSDADYSQTKRGINAGISHATHIFNAMRPMHHRDPAGLAAILLDDNISVQLISDGVHIHPAMIKLILKLKGIKNIVLITDSMSSQGLPDGKYVYDGWAYESRNGACRYKDGTLIGTSLPLNKMLKRMVELSGVSLLDALKMVTINPARILGAQREKGSIEEGKDADLVLMDKKLNVSTTIIGGKIVYKGGEKS